MTAGRGIVHSERTPDARRGQANPLHGLQIWLGLPDEHEQAEPGFQHYPAGTLPVIEHAGVSFELIAGSALGVDSKVRVHSPLCYLAAQLQPGQHFDWPRQYSEQAIYVVEGDIAIDGSPVATHCMSVLPDHESVRVESGQGARIAVLAGEPIGDRYLWWNFVASTRERLREAAELWASGGFERVTEDPEFIPLPDNRPMP
jgi:redox-sensitive bicupin YhaK (pirin superfamily)